MAAFRSLRQLSVASSRSFHTRLVTQIPSPTFAAQVLRQTSAFSTSAKRAAEPTSMTVAFHLFVYLLLVLIDQTSFVGKLEEEIRYEKENTLDSAFIKEFEEATDGIWKVWSRTNPFKCTCWSIYRYLRRLVRWISSLLGNTKTRREYDKGASQFFH